jgi:hypothetical protein
MSKTPIKNPLIAYSVENLVIQFINALFRLKKDNKKCFKTRDVSSVLNQAILLATVVLNLVVNVEEIITLFSVSNLLK